MKRGFQPRARSAADPFERFAGAPAHAKLHALVSDGLCGVEELEGNALEGLSYLTPSEAAQVLDQFRDADPRTVRNKAGFLYSLGKRLRTGSARTGSEPPSRTHRDARGRSPVGRRGPDGGGRGLDREPRDRSPPPPRGGGGVIRGSVMRPAAAPRLHPDAARLLDTLTRDGRVRPGDVNERCIAALADKPPAVQMESLETIGRKDVVRDNVRNPPAFYLGIIRRTAERMAGAVPATGGVPAGGAPPGRRYDAPLHQDYPPHMGPPAGARGGPPPGAGPGLGGPPAVVGAPYGAPYAPPAAAPYLGPAVQQPLQPGYLPAGGPPPQQGPPPHQLQPGPGPGPGYVPAAAAPANGAYLPPQAIQPAAAPMVAAPAPHRVHHGLEHVQWGVRVDEFHELSTAAPYVHPAAALKLQHMWDAGDRLLSLLDDRSWEQLADLNAQQSVAVIDETAAALATIPGGADLNTVNQVFMAVAEKHVGGGGAGGPQRMERTGPALTPQLQPAALQPAAVPVVAAPLQDAAAAVPLLPEELSGLGALLNSLTGARGGAAAAPGPAPAAAAAPPGAAYAAMPVSQGLGYPPAMAAAGARPPAVDPHAAYHHQPQPAPGQPRYDPAPALQAFPQQGRGPPAAEAPLPRGYQQLDAGPAPAATNGYAGPGDAGPAGPGQQPRGAPRRRDGAVDEEALFDRLGSHFVSHVRDAVARSRGGLALEHFDPGILSSLSKLPTAAWERILSRMRDTDMSTIEKPGAYIIGMIKKEREAASSGGAPPNDGYQRGPDRRGGGRGGGYGRDHDDRPGRAAAYDRGEDRHRGGGGGGRYAGGRGDRGRAYGGGRGYDSSRGRGRGRH